MQTPTLDAFSTGRETLELAGRLHRMPAAEVRRRTSELLELMGLTSVAERLTGTYSGGMKRRLDLASALMHRPQVLILDEPTEGLDPQSRTALWEELERISRAGTTMLLTTHYMEEAQRLCDRLVIMDHGKILTEGSPEALVEKLVGREVLEVRAPHAALLPLKTAIDSLESGKERMRETELVGDTLYVLIREKNGTLLEKVPDIQKLDFHLRPASLEDVFLKLAGRELRD